MFEGLPIPDRPAVARTPLRAARGGIDRRGLAEARLPAARQALANCRLCAHACGVDRVRGALGRCGAGPSARIFSAQVEVSDELELSPTYAMAFSGCDLRCDFCITGAESWNPRAGWDWQPSEVAAAAETALAQGARSLMILGGEPTVHLPAVLALVAALPRWALLAWKTNGHATAVARGFLQGLFDVWVVDYKFGNDACAERLAGVKHYTRVVRENLLWAASESRLLVRHLLMPGHVECCWRPVAAWLADQLPRHSVNLRPSYWPAWHADRHAGLQRAVAVDEAAAAVAIAREQGLRLIE